MKLEIIKKRPVSITYFVHGTTTDNENHIATGWNQGELSDLGKRQCAELRERLKGQKFDIVFCSDLKRAFDSAELIFDLRTPVVKDERLRECNYGNLNGAPSEKVESLTVRTIHKRFPNGESYKDVEKRMHSLVEDIKIKYSGKKVAIVSHRGPQLALDVILKKKTWEQAVKEDWRLKTPPQWKPGWLYRVTN